MYGIQIPKWYSEGMNDIRKCEALQNRDAFIVYITRKPNHKPRKKKGGK